MEREVLRDADGFRRFPTKSTFASAAWRRRGFEIRRIPDHLEMAAYPARPHGTVLSGVIRMEVAEAREKLKRLRETIRAALREGE